MPQQQLPNWRAKLQTPLLVLAAPATLIAWWHVAHRGSQIVLSPPVTAGFKRRVPADEAFDLSNLRLPRAEVRSGGPPKDGIPALTGAKFVASDEPTYLQAGDRVIGVKIGGEAKAYPLRILDYHEAVNDTVGGQPIAVTYCPLCDSSVVFDRSVGGEEIEFGISGLLYNSNVLLFDRGAEGRESLWSQMKSRAVSGPEAGRGLKRLPLEVTNWSAWRRRHPQTKVLSDQTGHNRRYDRSTYAGYFQSDRLMFPIDPLDERLPAKTPVLGASSGNAAVAFPLEALSAKSPPRLEYDLGGKRIVVVGDPHARSLRVESADPGIEWVYAFWFAWAAFEPDTVVYAANAPDQSKGFLRQTP